MHSTDFIKQQLAGFTDQTQKTLFKLGQFSENSHLKFIRNVQIEQIIHQVT